MMKPLAWFLLNEEKSLLSDLKFLENNSDFDKEFIQTFKEIGEGAKKCKLRKKQKWVSIDQPLSPFHNSLMNLRIIFNYQQLLAYY